jgi:predicted ATP-dependent protease
VLIPAANVKHLMLRRDVVEASGAGRFRIVPVETVDQAMGLLTGLPAGEIGLDGRYAAGSVNAGVAARLADLAGRAKLFGRSNGAPRNRPGGPE